MNDAAQAILKRAPVVPVIVIDDIDTALPLARALIAGGIPVLEITLRTPQGLDAIARIRGEIEGAVVGAGTVLRAKDMDAALKAGSEFIITPGLTESLISAATDCGVPFIPGIATVGELMRGMEAGLNTFKFFPAEAAGGVKMLKAFAGPFPGVRFCPTGGIGLNNLADYLALPSVLSVGGSWVAPSALVAAGDWEGITRLAREACIQVETIRLGAT